MRAPRRPKSTATLSSTCRIAPMRARLDRRSAAQHRGPATMAIAWVVFRENFDHRIFAGAAAILTGAVLLA
jgi:hypothetical protein